MSKFNQTWEKCRVESKPTSVTLGGRDRLEPCGAWVQGQAMRRRGETENGTRTPLGSSSFIPGRAPPG